MFSTVARTISRRPWQAARALTVLDIKGIKEEIIERSDYPIPKCLDIMKNETTAILGYGPQGRGQALNLKDNGVRTFLFFLSLFLPDLGFKVIVGVKKGKSYDAAVRDGWVPGKDLFDVEQAADKGTVVQFLISDAGQKEV